MKGFLLALLILFDIYALSFSFSTGLLVSREGTHVHRSIPAKSVLKEGQLYEYDFETSDIVGVLEVHVLRDLDREFLMKGKLIGYIKHQNGPSETKLGEFMRNEHFIVNSYTGGSPGVNFLSKLWNSCGNILINLAEGEGANESNCYVAEGPRSVNFDMETLSGLVYARASFPEGPVYSSVRIRIRSKSSRNKGYNGEAIAVYCAYLNLSLGGYLILKGMRDMKRAIWNTWDTSLL